MFRHLAVFVLFLVLVAGLAPARAEDDDPTFLDKKLSYWLSLIQEGKDAKTRRRGVLAVEQIGHAGSRKVVPALVKALREDKDPLVQAAAGRAVGRAVARAFQQARADMKDELPKFDYARDALGTALRTSKADNVREAAALALGDIGSDARGVVGSLAQGLEDKHGGTVKASASSLRRMGRDARDAQTGLQKLLADRKGEVEARVDAAVCLGQIRGEVPQLLPVLENVLADAKTDTRIRKACADSLGKLGKDAAGASPALAAVLIAMDSATDLRLAAVTALDQFGPDGRPAIPALIKVVSDEKLIRAMGDSARFVRCLAMHALGRMGKELDDKRKEAVAAVLKATEDPNVEVCVSAVETLGALASEGLGGQTEEVVKRLEGILVREGRKSIREAAQASLDKIRPKKEKAKD